VWEEGDEKGGGFGFCFAEVMFAKETTIKRRRHEADDNMQCLHECVIVKKKRMEWV